MQGLLARSKAIALPFCTGVPGSGFCFATWPWLTASEQRLPGGSRTIRPAPLSVARASASVLPTSFGTSTVAGPVEM